MKRYWLILPPIFSISLIILGILCLFWSSAALDVLSKALGVGFVFAGILQLFFYFFHHKAGFLPGFGWLAGSVTFAIGCVFLLNSHVSLLFTGICSGIWAIVWGVVRCYFALKKRPLALPWKTPLAGSIIYIISGIALLFSPLAGKQTASKILGVVLITAGVGVLYSWISTKHFFSKQFNQLSSKESSSTCTTNNR